MYTPRHFALSAEDTTAALAAVEFAQLVTQDGSGLLVTPLPLLYDERRHALLGHVARANPHWRAAGGASVAIATGPQGYVSPSWYATKAETGKVVPTWNYEVLAAHGRLIVHDDADWLLEVVTALTTRHERDRAQPWAVSDAPQQYTRAQLRAIVGVELAIERVEGKAKMSQNQPERNRAGVVDGLLASDDAADHALAQRVSAWGETGSTKPNSDG
jgi:transcriptional regulator